MIYPSTLLLRVTKCEKGLAGSRGGGESDSGVTKRVFGTILTWMQDRKSSTFLVFTANDVKTLPPELLRKGRLDEIFFVDLPSYDERQEIFRIHLEKRGRKPADFDLGVLATSTEGFVGSEIEEAVISGLYCAFDNGTALSTADIGEVIDKTKPLSVIMKEDIDAIRNWAKSRARPASSSGKQVVKIPQLGVRKLSNPN